MIFDANDMDRSLFDRTFDVCVVGSGPAGMTIALTLAEAGLDIAMMEGGGLEFTEQSQELYAGEVRGLDNFELDISRLRFMGGSSNHWYGRCRPFDAIDFLPRAYNPMSGWPITKADLDPFQERAAEIVDLPPGDWAPFTPVPEGGGIFQTSFWRRSPPTRFREKYMDQIKAAPNLALCLNSNLVNLRLNDPLDTIVGADFKSFDPGDPGFAVKATRYVLCLGGLENARVLLNFRDQMPDGIGNQNKLVGQYYHDHIAIDTADILLEKPLPSELTYMPTLEYQDAHQMLNGAFMVKQFPPPKGGLAKHLVRTVECFTPGVQRAFENLRDVTLRCKAGGITELLVQQDPENHPSGTVTLSAEQPLQADCKITLNDEKDAFGLYRLTMNWVLPDHFYKTVLDATVALGGVLAEQGIGRVRVRNWLLEEKPVLPMRSEEVGDIGSRHHMGTTRMASDPTRGVVDANCRIHGLTNIYVGGSSVFPTAGYANPTYSIVQVSLRLADHLKELAATNSL